MPAIATTDVVYQSIDAVVSAPGRVRRRVQLVFPSTNLQYQTGGVPLVGPSLSGTARGVVASLKVLGGTPSGTASMNPVWQWNGSTTAPKLIGIMESAAVADGVPFDQLANNFTFGAISQVVIVEVESG